MNRQRYFRGCIRGQVYRIATGRQRVKICNIMIEQFKSHSMYTHDARPSRNPPANPLATTIFF